MSYRAQRLRDVLSAAVGRLAPLRWLRNTWWRVVFWWKRQTGWLDLGETIAATGTVIEVDAPGADGDGNFDLLLDAGQERLITGMGGRLTSGARSGVPSLHCEVEPWAARDVLQTFGALRVGDRVRVTGWWGFDGVHTGRAEWAEVLLAVVRHMPAVGTGWFEVHPVERIERTG